MRMRSIAVACLLVGLVLLRVEGRPPTPAFALDSGDYYLRFLGSTVLSTTSPTAATAQFKDSPAVNRVTYQEVGVWAAGGATEASLRLSDTTALHVWLGLKNSDDQGTYFDIRAELRRNGMIIASGETKNIQGITRNANQAKEVVVTFGTPVNAQFDASDVLSVRVLAKVADSGGHNNAVGVRLYYDAVSRPARFGATFAPLNTAPVANAGADQTGVVGQTVQLDGSGSSDVDGDLLTYQWTLTERPTGSGATLTNPASVNPTITLDKPGSYTAQLIVHDGAVESAPDTVVLSTVNSAPAANAGPDQTGVVGQLIQLDGSGSSDVDGDPLTYQWTLLTQPSGSNATLTNATDVNPTLTLDKPGSYTAQLVVNDGTVNSAPDAVVVSTVNSAPAADAGLDQTGVVGQLIQLDGSGSSDVDGDSLTYQWSFTSIPPGSTAALSDPAMVAPTFVLDRPGVYVVQLLVNDGDAGSAPDAVTISTINSKPVANAGPDLDAQVGDTVQLDGGGSTDADGDALSYQWSLASAPAGSSATLTDVTTAQATFAPDVAGVYVAQLIVNDGAVDSEPDTTTVTVTVVDTTPPSPADLNHVTVGPVTNGQVTVTGAAGSVEGGARVTVTNLRTNQRVLVVATTEGGFILPIDAQLGDTLLMVVLDAAGNASLGRLLSIESAPGVVITEPAPGIVVSTTKVRVRGQVQGPANTGVTVNGVPAMILNGEFIVDAVPLEAGANELTAVATTRSGNTASHSVSVNREGTPPALELDASPQSGIAPLEVTLEYAFGSTTAIQSLSVDFDGDGTIDLTTTNPQEALQYTYTAPGLYLARVSLTDAQSVVHTAATAIVVYDAATMDVLFTSLWSDMNTALTVGDVPTALTFLTTGARVKYEPVFTVLLPHMVEILASYSPLQRVSLSGDIGEYAINRAINGQDWIFLIYFLTDENGAWRLDAM
jgi:hypothetical protein